MLKIYNIENTSYYRIGDVIDLLGVRKPIGDRIIKKIKVDPILSNYINIFKANTKGGQ